MADKGKPDSEFLRNWRWWHMFKEPLFWIMLGLLALYLFLGGNFWPFGNRGS